MYHICIARCVRLNIDFLRLLIFVFTGVVKDIAGGFIIIIFTKCLQLRMGKEMEYKRLVPSTGNYALHIMMNWKNVNTAKLNPITINLLNCLSSVLDVRIYNLTKYNKCSCLVFLIVISVMKMVDSLSKVFQTLYTSIEKLYKARFLKHLQLLCRKSFQKLSGFGNFKGAVD